LSHVIFVFLNESSSVLRETFTLSHAHAQALFYTVTFIMATSGEKCMMCR